MSEKKFTKFELARMKRTAQNVDQYITKKNKLVAKITELQAELDGLNSLIELTDAPTKAMTGGYGTEDIIKKVITCTDKLDKNGNVVKMTTYEFLYPETIIPVNTDESEETQEEVVEEVVEVPVEANTYSEI
jgi:hypothetical protein